MNVRSRQRLSESEDANIDGMLDGMLDDLAGKGVEVGKSMMQISFDDTRELYVELTFAKCVLAKCCTDRGESHEVMTTIGHHPDLGHVVIVQHDNLSVDLVTGSFPAFDEYRGPSIAAALEDTPEGEIALQKLEAHERLGDEVMLFAQTKARAAGVFEVVDMTKPI